jgi:pimeloyl-[acyl-carrier protein] methyl ester esterase
MRPVKPVFVHGWGFGPGFWALVVDALGWTDALVLDLGFLEGSGPASPMLAAQHLQAVQGPGEALLGIGHSLGFLWLAEHMALSPTDRLVGINAFAAFAARESFASGVPARILQRMFKGLSNTPEKVLADFYNLCGAPASGMVPCVPHLREGLDLLLAGDARPALAARAGQYGILAARQDPVATPAMTEQSFAGCAAVQWVDGGHLLPQTDVSACATFLQAARRTMEQDVQ